MRWYSYLKIASAGIFALGLLGECTTAVYDETANERLRRQYGAIHEETAQLERQIRLYERRMACVENPRRCGPVRSIDVRIVQPLEIRLEVDK